MQGQKAILILNDLEKSHRLGDRGSKSKAYHEGHEGNQGQTGTKSHVLKNHVFICSSFHPVASLQTAQHFFPAEILLRLTQRAQRASPTPSRAKAARLWGPR